MKNINRILVAIDRSTMGNEALKRAILISKEKNSQLIVMHVIESSFMDSPFVQTMDQNEIKKKVTKEIDRFISKENIEYVILIESGSASTSISLKAKSIGADLLIVGTHGKDDISSGYFGSTVLKLIQKTRIPVLIIKNEVQGNYKKMLAPTNLSHYSKESILFSRSIFETTTLKYLYAYVSANELQAMTYRLGVDELGNLKKEILTEAHIALDDFVKDVGNGEMAFVECTASVNEDILEYIEKDDADLLVLGSKGVGNLNSFIFGSTASYLVKNAPRDILVYVPIVQKIKSEAKSTKEGLKPLKEEVKPEFSPIQKDLDSRKDEIRDDFDSLFETNLKLTNWNVPEAPDQEIAEGLVDILEEKLKEIIQKVKEGKYQEKRNDIFQ